jgi:hypothetical protein
MTGAGQVYVDNNITARIQTYDCLSERVPSLRVEFVEWDSGFRGSGLRIGDRITAVNGTPAADLLQAAVARGTREELIGGWGEAKYWARLKAAEGTSVTLTVRRQRVPQGWDMVDVTGTLRAGRSYRDGQNTPTLWPDGPNNYQRDGFFDAWPPWYEKLKKLITKSLCDTWRIASCTSQSELKELLEHAPRVEMLTTKYPGPFADAVRQDFDAAVAANRGALHALTGEDLAYRRADEERIAEIAALGKAAFDAAVSAAAVVPAFPAPHPIHTPHEERVGRLVLLPDIPTRQWINDGDLSFLLAGSDADGWYAVSVDAAPAQRLFTALRRYQRRVNPKIAERYTILGRIVPEARIVVFAGQGRWCWQVEPVAGWIGGAMFVDLTRHEDGVSRFAGEEGLLKPQTAVPPDDASPGDLLEAMIAAIKAGDLGVWKQLFATWQIRERSGLPEVRYHVYEVREDDFEMSRRSFATRLFDARVHWIDDVEVVITGDEFPGAPRLERVEAEIEHVGRFDDEYRGFIDITLKARGIGRTSVMLDGGPDRLSAGPRGRCSARRGKGFGATRTESRAYLDLPRRRAVRWGVFTTASCSSRSTANPTSWTGRSRWPTCC